jgi:hypothetical protein
VTILNNTLFHAQGRWDMSVVEKCLSRQDQRSTEGPREKETSEKQEGVRER